MEVKQNNQYYLYNNQTQTNNFIMVEENKLLKQLQEAGKFNKNLKLINFFINCKKLPFSSSSLQ